MIVRDIQARVLLLSGKGPDPWFGIRYTMNLYRGCQHQCIYCDSRSECYRIENFGGEVLVKANALERLERELARKRSRGTIGTGSMNDPYMPLEAERNLTGRALAVIAQHGFPVHIITKSDLVLRDLETIRAIGRVYAAVTFTITAADDALSKKVEPGAPASSRRFEAIAALASRGILTGVALMPVLPFILDTEENILTIVRRAKSAGAQYILPAFGVTLRDRQREYYYRQLDLRFPGLRDRYEKIYGQRYSCRAPQAERLEKVFRAECDRLGLATRMPFYIPEPPLQAALF